ncbi:MAG: zinc ribbon domain-containing protein, partial [Candidatus Thermoplasmatota archaeon]|nr:zinc ribbon domain-containing protein [Candidatus Thermoplasmatota archaeon]
TAPPSVDEQKAMWGSGSGGQSQPLIQQQPQTQVFGAGSSGMSGSTQEISAAMGEEEGAEIDPDIAELMQSTSQSQSGPSTPSISSDLLSEFEDDEAVEREEVDFSHEDSAEDEISNWEPSKDDETPETPAEEPDSSDRTVRQNCSSCEEMFEVTMPPGVDAARTECPHCGSVESVSLD